MKNIIRALLLTFIIYHVSIIDNCRSQWNIQLSGTTAILEDMQFINSKTGWICGSGIILKTTNGGTNWFTQTHPATNKTLDDIYVVDSNVAYCVGYWETILKTTNGGENWIALKNGPWGEGQCYESVYFLDDNTGWIGGSNYYIYKTTNGGISFDSTYVFWGYFQDIYFKDSLHGIVCAYGSGLFTTSNGGLNWLFIQLPNGGVLGDLHKLNIINNKYVWVVGTDDLVFHSTDFGATWDSIGRVIGSDIVYCSFFSSMNTGWAGGSYGRLFKSTNGGYNWINQNLATAYQRAIVFIDDYTGWTCGGGGRILHTNTGGVTTLSDNNKNIPEEYVLEQNFPNPFNAGTIIDYSLSRNAFIELSIFNIAGKRINTLVNKTQNPGNYKVIFKSGDLPSGIYFYRLLINNSKQITKKMIIAK